MQSQSEMSRWSWSKVTSAALFALSAFSLLTAAPLTGFAETWQIDPVHTNVQFSVRHMMISNIRGEFEKVAGTVSSNGNDPNSVQPDSVQIDATIDASSINTRVQMRDNDLKSAHFLDVAKYPTISFKSKKIEQAGAGKWKVTGDLTLHGVTNEVVLDAEGPSSETKDPFGNRRVGASATAKISRKDFGLTYNPTLETGGVVVGDEVAITIDVEVIKKAATASAGHEKNGLSLAKLDVSHSKE